MNEIKSLVIHITTKDQSHVGGTAQAVVEWLGENGFIAKNHLTIKPDPAELTRLINEFTIQYDLLIVCGGTGLGPNDITPQTVERLCDFPIPGLGELLRAESRKFSMNSYLSRGGGYVKGNTLVLAIPGNVKAAIEQLSILRELLPAAIDALHGRCRDRNRVKEAQTA